MSEKILTHGDYAVAWICALDVELAAAKAMLDSIHPVLPSASNDDNSYTLGRIGDRNVVMACLPSGVYGDLIRLGGGVPSKGRGIRLGDIIVSNPTGTFGGVVQYDSSKFCEELKRTGALNKPSFLLLAAIQKLKEEHLSRGSRVPDLIARMISDNPRLEHFRYQGRQNDRLFAADYEHRSSNECDDCEPEKLISRIPRSTNEPVAHYGLIASGNQVMRHGHTRDRLAQKDDILCFELEAAGLMDNFPCLIIRGVSDYADSHKNKKWQPYAAATAAAYTKELLSIIPPKQPHELRTVASEEAGNDFSKDSVPVDTSNALQATYCRGFIMPKSNGMGPWGIVLRDYVERGNSLGVQDDDGRTPLHHAIETKYDREGKVGVLVEMGADITRKDSMGRTPIDVAKNVDGRLFNFLLDVWKKSRTMKQKEKSDDGIKSSGTRTGDGQCPLKQNLVLAKQTGPLVKSEGGIAPEDYPQAGITARLLGNGFDVNAESFNADQALLWAVSTHGDRQDVIGFLLNNGASATAEDDNQCIALHWAAVSGKDLPRSRIDHASTSARHGRHERIELLLDNTADADVVNNKRQTALQVALTYGHEAVIALFKERKESSGKVNNARWQLWKEGEDAEGEPIQIVPHKASKGLQLSKWLRLR
ncbi:uncharacterized protein DFL_003125 [Arthrobotrys flagrans]|uniref:Uncharacterized protein n=1 Tax=Arthrobotrys flagrans TaxID=97331 RepID=A0A437ACN9_ARTFL|nr:hypothetical protein DFL_003125 [Arthrobotrys flagrans]